MRARPPRIDPRLPLSRCSFANVRNRTPASLLALLGALASSAEPAADREFAPDPHPSPRLASLRVAGAGPLTPAFAPGTFHYAVRRCGGRALSVSASAGAAGVRLRLNGALVPGALSGEPVRPDAGDDIVVEPEGAAGVVAYTVHCVPDDFPEVEIPRKLPGAAPGLLLVTPTGRPGGRAPASHLAMLDDNGVPRFARRVSPGAHNFRWHGRARLFSYNEAPPNGAGDVVLLDEGLREAARANTVGGLAPAMMHDFLITDEGNRLFVANNPATRDLGRYPGREGGPAPPGARATRDAVIQEVAPDGREVFRWNAWDHLRLSDCAGWWNFPGEYAKLNSLDLVDGDIVASFRACSAVLKIERPSGRVVWQLGGGDPAAPDAFDGRRPVFERPWYRVTGDPRGGFCAQHSVRETAPGTILMFDNGQCPDGARRSSRVVEYRLVGEGRRREAAFVRHHEPGRRTFFGGAVAPLANGNWLISWGGGPGGASVTEVDPASGREVFALRLYRKDSGAPLMTYRAFRHAGPEPPRRSAPQSHP